MPRVGLVVVCLVGAVLVVGAAVASGAIPIARITKGHDSARPPCEQLPGRQAVGDALTAHQDLARRIEQVGPGVKVSVATPCKGQPDRAIVKISYGSEAEWKGVDAIVREEGFGVAVQLLGD